MELSLNKESNFIPSHFKCLHISTLYLLFQQSRRALFAADGGNGLRLVKFGIFFNSHIAHMIWSARAAPTCWESPRSWCLCPKKDERSYKKVRGVFSAQTDLKCKWVDIIYLASSDSQLREQSEKGNKKKSNKWSSAECAARLRFFAAVKIERGLFGKWKQTQQAAPEIDRTPFSAAKWLINSLIITLRRPPPPEILQKKRILTDHYFCQGA